jgi:hypothetical protein
LKRPRSSGSSKIIRPPSQARNEPTKDIFSADFLIHTRLFRLNFDTVPGGCDSFFSGADLRILETYHFYSIERLMKSEGRWNNNE